MESSAQLFEGANALAVALDRTVPQHFALRCPAHKFTPANDFKALSALLLSFSGRFPAAASGSCSIVDAAVIAR